VDGQIRRNRLQQLKCGVRFLSLREPKSGDLTVMAETVENLADSVDAGFDSVVHSLRKSSRGDVFGSICPFSEMAQDDFRPWLLAKSPIWAGFRDGAKKFERHVARAIETAYDEYDNVVIVPGKPF
jgi:hypothetical protein